MLNEQESTDIKLRHWILPLGILLALLSVLLIADHSAWTFQFKEAAFFESLLNSKFFTEWFAPYNKSELNILALFLSVIFLPEIIINVVQYIKLRRKS
ncbi:YfzA family protein [Oceanobacillus oncorhynchi]|uniref:YfzA family protein n=1 Tax=Oceanobacillus oncorhynchi TaxID=545501 RepID=UPI0034D3E6D8